MHFWYCKRTGVRIQEDTVVNTGSIEICHINKMFYYMYINMWLRLVHGRKVAFFFNLVVLDKRLSHHSYRRLLNVNWKKLLGDLVTRRCLFGLWDSMYILHVSICSNWVWLKAWSLRGNWYRSILFRCKRKQLFIFVTTKFSMNNCRYLNRCSFVNRNRA